MAITWNVRAEGSINGNSVHSKNKNLTLTAEKGSVVLSPEAFFSGGFGSAVVAGFKTSVQISAGERIVLNIPAHPEDQKDHLSDHLSIALGEGSTASLKAKNIIVYGSIGWMPGAQAALKASESVHIALSEQKRNSVHHPLWVFDSSFIIDAPTLLLTETFRLLKWVMNITRSSRSAWIRKVELKLKIFCLEGVCSSVPELLLRPVHRIR